MAIGGGVSTTLLCVRLLLLVGNRPIHSAPALLIGAISAGAAISNQGPLMGERENLISALFVRTADLKPSLAIKNHLVLFLRPS